MILKTTLFGHTYEFKSVREVMAKANEEKSGDKLAGIAAETAEERVAAKVVLSNLTLNDLRNCPAVPYEEDEVTRIIQDSVNETIFNEYKNMTVAEFREWLLDTQTTPDMIRRASRGLTSEIVAGVCKLMSNLDLIYAAKKMRVTAHCNTTIGTPGTFACRLQPNHPTDDVAGVTASLLEGLSYGIGDAVIGLNPAIDTVESTTAILNLFNDVKNRLEIPTQICVLSHITTQMQALQNGAPMDLLFQSIAGSEKGLSAFGTGVNMLAKAKQMMQELGTSQGPNQLYFETGQGSELSSSSHNGADQVTMESRCYGLARHFSPYLVNTVVGFIGPEYIYDSKQLTRAALEDNFCGHLHGLPMGCDICYTNHMVADQNDADNLLVLLANAGCHYVIGVPQSDDVMLMYQSTSYHDVAATREMLGLHPIPEFERWCEDHGILENGKLTPLAGQPGLLM